MLWKTHERTNAVGAKCLVDIIGSDRGSPNGLQLVFHVYHGEGWRSFDLLKGLKEDNSDDHKTKCKTAPKQ